VRGTSLAPFRQRVFALFWVGSFVSNVGTVMEQVALGIYVQQRTGQAGWNGAVAALGFLPTALLGPLGGVLADRVSRRRLMVGTTSASLVLAAGMTVLVGSGRGTPWAIAAISFATGCANALAFPAFQSMLPDLVPRDELVAAVGLSGAQWNLARVVAPALAGLVVAATSVTVALAVNTVSFVAVLAVLSAVRLPPPAGATAGQSVRAAFARGWRHVRRDPALSVVVGAQGLNCLFASAYIGLVPAVARKIHGGAEGLTAALGTAMGVGAVTAAVTFGSLTRRLGARRVLGAVVVALPVATSLYALAPGPRAALVALALLAYCYLTSISTVASVTQVRAPAALRGRVLSVNNVTLGLLYPVAVALQGRLGDLVGLREAMVVFAVAHLAVVVAIRVVRPQVLAPLDGAAPPDAPVVPAAAAAE
jgi:MFS family permease